MKRLLLIVCSLAIAFTASAQAVFKADERFELTSIAARLAGYYEYTQGSVPEYNAAIDEYFAPHRLHKLINHLQRIRMANSVAYDAIPTATRALVIKDGGIAISPDADVGKLCEADTRWTEESFRTFVEYLDDFYRKTDFHSFFEDNSALYAKGEALVNSFSEVDTSWFMSFFGKPLESPQLYISFVNGPSNYAMTDSGAVPGFGILMGLWFDPYKVTHENISEDQKYGFINTVIHELCHNFSNPVTKRWRKELDRASERIFFEDDVMQAMSRIAYGEPYIMTSEWINNLCEMMYFKEKGLLYPEGSGAADPEVSDACGFSAFALAARGFYWMDSSIELMDGFYENRDKYPYFEDFMPEIVGFYNSFSKNTAAEREKYEVLYPRVTGFAVDSADADRLKLHFTFSVPMNRRFMTTRFYPNGDAMSLDAVSASFDDEYTFTVGFDRRVMEKGERYGGTIDAWSFRSCKAYPMRDNYQFEFIYQ